MILSDKTRPINSPLNLKAEASGALQYSIVGWAKWNNSAFRNVAGNMIFTLSIYEKANIANRKKLGDVVLAIYLKRKYLVFETYKYRHRKNKDRVSVTHKKVIISNYLI